MPSGNEDAYRRMYEMGKELMEMAKMGGYDPEGGEEVENEAVDAVETAEEPTSKISTALGFLRK